MGVITITNGRHNNVGMEQGLQRDGRDGGQAPGVHLCKFHPLIPHRLAYSRIYRQGHGGPGAHRQQHCFPWR
jgi:hypothetical protein